MHWHEPDPDLLPPATLSEARELREDLSRLLAAERTAAAAFLVALADFDARLGWEPLGHASLFGFLNVEMGLSKGAAFLRFTAVRLMRRFPEVTEALRSGQLCLSAIGELARVMTPENRAEVLPRFFGCSSREARLVAAAVAPRESPPRRELVTRLPLVSRQRPLRGEEPGAQGRAPAAERLPEAGHAARPEGGSERPLVNGSDGPGPVGEPEASTTAPAAGLAAATEGALTGTLAGPPAEAPMQDSAARDAPPSARAEVRAHELAPTRPARVPPGPECEPLDADLRRLHLTVSRGLLAKLEAARGVLSHVLPGATTEQVLEAALDLLLDRQARAAKQLGRARRGRRLARRAAASSIGAQVESAADSRAEAKAAGRTAFVTASRGVSDGEDQASAAGLTHVAGRPHRRQDRDARAIPAAVEREVRARDGGRCQFPLDAGGICGSTTRIQLDHVVPVALGGQATVENLRLLCATHNRYAARLALGEGVMAMARRRGAKREGGGAMRRDHTQTFD